MDKIVRRACAELQEQFCEPRKYVFLEMGMWGVGKLAQRKLEAACLNSAASGPVS